MRVRVAGVIAAISFLSLVTNRLPALPAVAFALAALISIRSPDRLSWSLTALWGYWIVSFLVTQESVRVLISMDFHRRDGQIFFSLLPILALAWVRADANQIRPVLACFLIIQALIALGSSIFDLFGKRDALVGITFLFDEGGAIANYCALYQAHNAAGSVQALGCLIAIALAVFSDGARVRWFWGALTVPLLWGVVLSKSRGAFLAMSLSAAVVAAIVLRRRRFSRRALAGIAFSLILTALLFGARFAHRMGQFADESGTHTGRWELWKRGLQEWSWSPIIGEGMGRYNDVDRQWSGIKHLFYVVTKASVRNDSRHAHNSYIHFLAEGGIVGLAVTVGFWTWVTSRFRRSREPLRIAAFLGILYLFAISFTEHYMGGGAMLLVLSSLVGAAWNLPEPPVSDTLAPS